jgi:ATP-dependent DNA helicase RecG
MIAMTTPEEFRSWLNAPEGARLEFKTAAAGYHFEKLVEYCVALANEGGGRVILGVTDRRPRDVVGTAAFPEPGRTEAGLHQRLGRRVAVEEHFHEGRRVLIVHVPGRLPGTAWSVDGRYLRRAGDELVPIGDAELRTMLLEAGGDFSAERCPGASLSCLAPDAVSAFRARWAQKAGGPRIEPLGDVQLLADAELTVDGVPTYAALILLGTREALGRHLAQAEVIFEYRSSDASGPAQDRAEFREGLLLFADRLWDRINLRNDRQSYQDGLFRYDIPTFDEAAIREALLNAVAHRDYRLGGSVFVRQYPRRLEVVSPGGFPPGITPDNILDQQNPRNRRLAEALSRCGLVERSGQGLNLMVEQAVRHGKALPDFTGTSAHEVRLTLDGTARDPSFVRFLERLGAGRLQHFSTYDFLALDAIGRDLPLTDAMRARLPGLIEAGAVESVGRGRGARYLLSRALYASLGRRGAYTRRRGLDHETNKALLLKHLAGSAPGGAAMAELMQVLPALSRAHVKRVLRELAGEGRVRMSGVKRSARWFAADGGAIGSGADDEPIGRFGAKGQGPIEE